MAGQEETEGIEQELEDVQRELVLIELETAWQDFQHSGYCLSGHDFQSLKAAVDRAVSYNNQHIPD